MLAKGRMAVDGFGQALQVMKKREYVQAHLDATIP
jgi:hypothetical protein